MPGKSQKTNFLLLTLLLIIAGCETFSAPQNELAEDPVKVLTAENEKLKQQTISQRIQIQQLNSQLYILRTMPSDRIEQLVKVDKIEFGRFTRSFDENKDGLDDGFNAYLVLLDVENDKIKAAGQVQIELWNLAAEHGGRQLGTWFFAVDQMQKHFLSGVMTDYYKFSFTWPENNFPRHSNLTLKLRYSDALTGSVFEIQKMITATIYRPER